MTDEHLADVKIYCIEELRIIPADVCGAAACGGGSVV